MYDLGCKKTDRFGYFCAMFTEIPSAKWRALVGATLKLASVSPWEWLKEGQTFGVQIQETGEKIYCSVMGQVGVFDDKRRSVRFNVVK